MIFLVVLGLTVVIGVRSEYDCKAGPPPCLKEVDFRDALQEYAASGKVLPSNEILKTICPDVIKAMECIREHDALHCLVEENEDIDFTAVYNSVTTFCNEESDVRKGYAAHVDCVNNINFTSQACLITLENKLKELRKYERDGVLEEKEISSKCLILHLFKSCAVEMAEESCGTEAGKTADTIMTGIENIFRCSDNDLDAFAEVLSELNSRIETLI